MEKYAIGAPPSVVPCRDWGVSDASGPGANAPGYQPASLPGLTEHKASVLVYTVADPNLN
jgi:hypothetical protein